MAHRPEWTGRLRGISETPEIGRKKVEFTREALHNRLPGEPELRPAVKEKERGTLSGSRNVKTSAVNLNGQMVHLLGAIPLSGA
jgi:hypothetical protein